MAWFERMWFERMWFGRMWFGRIRNAIRPGRLERDLDRELSFHMLERAEELEQQGLTREEATRQARVQIGNYTLQRERTRDMDIQQWMEAAARNTRVAVRALRRTPGFTATVLATLALGIGANTAVFSALDAVVLRPMPFPESDRLTTLGQFNAKAREPYIAPVRLAEWDRLNHTFQAISGYESADDASETSGELPDRVSRTFVAPRFLEVWGIAPALGRDFSEAEWSYGGPSATIVSDHFWRRRFNADPNVIGKQLHFGQSSSTIVGVMPASFLFPERGVDLWMPMQSGPWSQSRDLTWFTGIGRLKPGLTIEQARADLYVVQAGLAQQFPKPDAQITPAVEPLKESTIGGVRQSLWILFGSVSLLLLIACTNVAALLLSRAASRRQEIAVRFSLGASRSAVAAHLLTEVLILAIGGAGLGLVLASTAAGAFRSLAGSLPRMEEVTIDWRIAGYSMACAVAATLVCGILPAVRGTRGQLARGTRGNRTTVSSGNRVQLGLVGVQVALAVMLLAGAALLVRSFEALSRVSPGFDASHILTFEVSSSWFETGDPLANQRRVERILDGLRAIPGVEDASISMSLPGVPWQFQVEFRDEEGRSESEPKIVANSRAVSPSFFGTMRIGVLQGQVCRDDVKVHTAMVNRTFANSYFAGSSPIGHHLSQPGNMYIPKSEITGVVSDAKVAGLDRTPGPMVYWCLNLQQPGTHFLARTHGDPAAMAETIRRKMHELEPIRSVYNIKPLEDQISEGYAENRLRTALLASFAALAIVLACVGLYGTLSYAVNVRRREVGLRLALGAMRSGIVGQFVSQGLLVSAAGCAAGIALAWAFTGILAGMLFGVSPTDPATLGSVVALVLGVSAMASVVPAIRAARVEPMEVLRED
jgi:putative ABC transport system permease protein